METLPLFAAAVALAFIATWFIKAISKAIKWALIVGLFVMACYQVGTKSEQICNSIPRTLASQLPSTFCQP